MPDKTCGDCALFMGGCAMDDPGASVCPEFAAEPAAEDETAERLSDALSRIDRLEEAVERLEEELHDLCSTVAELP